MKKKDFLKTVKNKMKLIGFISERNHCYKLINNDYLIGISLDHHPFCKGYFIDCGVVYLCGKEKSPLGGIFDYNEPFVFTKNSGDDLNKYNIEEWEESNTDMLIDYFEYGERSEEELCEALDINIKKRLSKFYDKEYALNQYRNNWILFRKIPYETVDKIVNLTGLNRSEVYRIRDGNVKGWPNNF